jgi:CheY-like chemotaxis protein
VLALVTASVDHCAALVKQVLTFARGVEGARVVVNPVHLLNDIQSIICDTFPKNIELVSDWSRGIWTVIGDPTQLHQVFINLCVNARDAMPRGGTLTLTMENAVVDDLYAGMNPDSKPGSYVMVKVQDTGTGIPPEISERIFEPFFTTKEIGKGTGLGLSTTMGIVKSHGGFINLYSEMGKGTIFKVYLPANTASKAVGSAAATNPPLPRGNGELVLLVDDEERLRIMAQAALEKFGYRVMPAANGAEAVALYAQYREVIAIVITDMAMPVMNGPSTIVALRTLNPRVKVIGSSGMASGVGDAAGSGIKHFVRKPYSAETMMNVLAEALREEA